MQTQIPHLKATPASKQLIVNGDAFLMLAAELQNSSMTSAKYMKEVWPKLVAANINTVLGCVTWEDIEPEEGKFDFSNLEEVIEDARGHGLRLILLWFGSFKNGMLAAVETAFDALPSVSSTLSSSCRHFNLHACLGQER